MIVSFLPHKNKTKVVTKMDENKKNKLSKDEEVIKAYQPDFTNIKSDITGSYTGIPEYDEVPEQDVDDL